MRAGKRAGLGMLLAAWGWAAGAQVSPEALALVEAHPALGAAPPPAIVRMHAIVTSSAPHSDFVAGNRQLIAAGASGIAEVRADGLSTSVFVVSPGTPGASYHESVLASSQKAAVALGGLLYLGGDYRLENRTEGRTLSDMHGGVGVRSVEGSLFPLAVGNRMKVALARTITNRLRSGAQPLISEAEHEFIVRERQEALERNGLRVDGGVFTIEELRRTRVSGSGGYTTRKVAYYSEKYRWVIAQDSTLRTGGEESLSMSMPVLLVAAGAQNALQADLDRYDRELAAVLRATAEEYLGPRRRRLAALVPGRSAGPAGRAGGSATSIFVACGSIGESVRRSLLAFGLSRLAERSEDFVVKSGAGFAAKLAREC